MLLHALKKVLFQICLMHSNEETSDQSGEHLATTILCNTQAHREKNNVHQFLYLFLSNNL